MNWTSAEMDKMWRENYRAAMNFSRRFPTLACSILFVLLPIAFNNFNKNALLLGGTITSFYLMYGFFTWLISSSLISQKANMISRISKKVILMSIGFDACTLLVLAFSMLWLAWIIASHMGMVVWLKLFGLALIIISSLCLSWLRAPRVLKGQGDLFSTKELRWVLIFSGGGFALAALVRGTDYEPLLGIGCMVLVAETLLTLVAIKFYSIALLSRDWRLARV